MSHPLKANRLETALIYMLSHMAALYIPDKHGNLKDDVPLHTETHYGQTRNLTVGHVREAHRAYHALVDGQESGYIDSQGMKDAIAIVFPVRGGGKSG